MKILRLIFTRGIYLTLMVFMSIIVWGCSSSVESNDYREIISMVFNDHIGIQQYYGVPPIPPLPPDFDSLNQYRSPEEAKKYLRSAKWSEYFRKLNSVNETSKQWHKNQEKLRRTIVVNSSTNVNELFRNIISIELGKTHLEYEEVHQATGLVITEIDNQSNYDLLSLSKFRDRSLDSIHIGILSFSEVMFTPDKNHAALYYDWWCRGNCGYGSLVFLNKVNKEWRIDRVIELWVS